jgi:signal peptidase I
VIASASLLPGLGQWLQGRRRAAGALLGLALLLAVALIASIRNPLSGTVAALALLLIWYSVWDAARHAFPLGLADEGARFLRLVRLALLSAAMLFSTLAGGYLLLARRYELMVINTFRYTPVLLPGDELMVRRLEHPLARLRRGDVVIGSPGGADPRSWVVHYGGEAETMAPPAGAGPIIDRVIGLPGDRIDGAGTSLWVNGAPLPPERWPLAFTPGPRFTAVVPPGCVAVWEPGAGAEAEPLFMLPASGINGQVVAVTGPVERRRWVR